MGRNGRRDSSGTSPYSRRVGRIKKKNAVKKYEAGGIQWAKTGGAEMNGEVAVKVDIAKLDAFWKQNPNHYVGPGGVGEIKGRYTNAMDFLKKTKKGVHMPRLGLTDDNKPSITDGRHRIAAMRDMGKKTIYITVDKSEAAQFRKLIGAK
jgi:hypothetical protein